MARQTHVRDRRHYTLSPNTEYLLRMLHAVCPATRKMGVRHEAKVRMLKIYLVHYISIEIYLVIRSAGTSQHASFNLYEKRIRSTTCVEVKCSLLLSARAILGAYLGKSNRAPKIQEVSFSQSMKRDFSPLGPFQGNWTLQFPTHT